MLLFRRKKARFQKAREDKPVEVNQRGLIQKTLARYPGEFTVFRELLQNSDDAHSSTVEIHFDTTTLRVAGVELPTPPNSKFSDVVRWTFKNDGRSFTQNDWTRLAKIAEGNPDPATVGAFGVGFYSLFSVTDRPSVSSGTQQMELYWKDGKDQLYIHQEDLPSKQLISSWTIIDIPLRERGSMPKMIDFMRFLATSITFMVHLKDVSIWFNRQCIGRVKKELLVPAETIELPIRMERSSPLRMMVINEIRRYRFTIQAETSVKSWETSSIEVSKPSSAGQFLPRLETPPLPLQTGNSTRSCTAKLGLTVFSAEVNVKENEKLSREVIRCTDKKPPSRLKYNLVYTGKEEYDLNFANPENQLLMSIFQGLRADLNGAFYPRIFIGHSTSQTTGFGGHMASSFIPTVERESVDLVNAPIWNSELLYVGGFLSRVVYELELSALQTIWERATEHDSASDSQPSLESQNQLHQHFIYILKFFTFHHSTPSPKVAQLLQKSFYACSNWPLRFLSSIGVRHASDIRFFDPICAKFLKHVPILPQDVAQAGLGITKALPSEHQIRLPTLSDVLRDLREHTLNDTELVACLHWQLHHGLTSGMAELSQVARFQGADGAEIELSSIQYFTDSDGFGTRVPSDGPLPPFLMPLKVTKHFTPTHLTSFGWREFTIADWLRYISQPQIMLADPRYDFTQSSLWAESVLNTVSYAWASSDEIRHLAESVFANKTCIPTINDLRCPEDSYLPDTNTFASDDLNLPTVQFPSGREISTEMRSLLLALGVRRHLPPQLILRRMVETGKWNTLELVNHLVQVANSLTPTELSELKSSDTFTMEGVQKDASKTRFRADELYPPKYSFRQLQFPLIEWEKRSKWRDESPEAKLLYRLGLRRHPPLDVVIELCSSQNATVSTTAFEYLCTNFRSVYSDYHPGRFRDVAFVPAEKIGGPCLEKLGNVFLGDQWKTLEFPVIRHRHWEDVIEQLGVQHHPPPSSLLHLLETKPPWNEEVARQWFEILSEHAPSFSSHEHDILSQLQIVPKKTISGFRMWLPPVHCYVGRSTGNTFYLKLFHFVNFGLKANRFLSACGAKTEPSEKDVASSLIDNPERFYELAGGHEQFLQEVGVLASRHTRIPNDTLSKMRVKPVLLCFRREITTSPDRWENVPLLREPREIVIVDDIHAYQLFGGSITAAPRDMPPELERFYVFLGCRYLSTTVSEQCKESREILDTATCSKFRDLVLQRVPFFLQQYPNYQPQILVSWSSNPDVIVVRLWEHLSVSKTFHFGNMKITKEQDMWATAKYEDGKIQLWLSDSAKQDIYEIAMSICRVLFGRVKLSDALLLTTLLSEDLDVLKRRGYEVDQVLKSHQHTEGLGLTDAASSYCSITPETPGVSTPFTAQHPVTETSLDPILIRSTTNRYSLPGSSELAQGSLTSSLWLPLSVTNVVNNARDAFRVATRSLMSSAELSGTTTAVLPPSPWAPRQVMPRTYIRSNVDKAIKLCNSGEAIPVQHPKHTDVIKFLNNGYCDVTEPIGSLQFLGTMENIDVYTDQDTPSVDQFMNRMHEPLTHFICIILPIAKIYNLPVRSLRIFYNDTAGCIAFNCKGILYLNLRYFEAWHYQDVKNDKPQRALSSWFLTFAHEIAHNLVTRHDAEHEFWFSAICEAYINEFSRLLGSASVSGSRVDGG